MRDAIETRDERLERLEREANNLAERVQDRERRLQAALHRLGEVPDNGETWPLIPPVGRSLDDIRTQARRLADGVRKRALRDAAHLADRLVERAGLRDMLESAGVRPFAWIDPLDQEWGEDADEVKAGARDDVFEGEVDVEIGPLKDFAALSSIEDAANEIDSASDINVERFSGGRATLSIDLNEPVELLRELEKRAPMQFRIRSLTPDRVVLDVEGGDEADSARSEAA